MLEHLFSIFLKAVFIENMVFGFFLGMCSYLAVSKSVKTANGLGMAVTFVLVTTVPVNYLVYKFLLRDGALSWIGIETLKDVDLSFLTLIMFIAVVAAFVQLVEMFVEKFSPALNSALGIFLPLIAVNCAIMGGALFMQQRVEAAIYNNGFEVAVFALGSGIGWWLAITSIAAIREKVRYSNIPAPLRGAGIAFITTGLMAIAFMSFMGIEIKF